MIRSVPTRRLRRLLVGSPQPTAELEDALLPKTLALPIFSSDALSSVAYATEAALVVLVAVSLAAAQDVLWISIAVATLLAVVVLSYRQTIVAYEKGGGAYVVAKENLGTFPGLVAAAALLVDYTLTVAVSVSAGILALTSAAPELAGARVELALGAIGLLTLANLRGTREAGRLFALPTYGFVLALFAAIVTGIARCADGVCPQAHTPDALAAGTAASVGVFVLLKAFASGSSALTGVEAIANGIAAFRRPKARNARATLTIMAAIAIVLFLGVSFLAVETDARPSESTSVLAQIVRASFPADSGWSWLYYAVQGLTLGILVLAANTAYQGFPRLTAIVARDRFAPRQFANLGDRLVYSNGILVLAGLAAALVAIFRANVNSLIHLYVVGVFTAFTLSQSGMVVHWWRHRAPGWRRRAAINGAGATATGLVTAIVVATKFLSGAWAVLVAVPLLVWGAYAVHRHYRNLGRELREGLPPVAASTPPTLAAVELGGGAPLATWFAQHLSENGAPVVASSAAELDAAVAAARRAGSAAIVITERLRGRSGHALRRQLVRDRGVALAEIGGAADAEPRSAACRVLVAGAHAAALESVRYAEALGFEDTRALFFPLDDDEGSRVAREWRKRGFGVELDELPDTHRDLAEPLLLAIRAITAEPGKAAVIVMTEMVLPPVQRVLLHSRHTAYVRGVLLREAGVVLLTVPYRPPELVRR